MLSKIKYLGVFTIILFSSFIILLSGNSRDRGSDIVSKLSNLAKSIENRFYDFRMRNGLDPSYIDKRVTLVAIDDYSIKKIGKWPFPRENYSKLMNKLKKFGAKTIAYDVFFSEESLTCPGSNVDEEFANALQDFQSIPGNSVIIPYSLSSYPTAETFENPPESLLNRMVDARSNPIENEKGEQSFLSLAPYYVEKKVFPIPEIQSTSTTLGHLQVEPDTDGIIRKYHLLGNVQFDFEELDKEGNKKLTPIYLPSIALAAYENHTNEQVVVELAGLDNYRAKLLNGNMELNVEGETKVRWIGAENNFPTLRFWDVMTASDDDPRMKEIFDGNIVFIGSTAFGAHDLRHTPVDPLMAGVYFHMNMVHQLLDGHTYKSTEESIKWTWILMIAGTLLIILVQFFGNAIFDLMALVLIGAVVLIIDKQYFVPMGYEVKLFSVLFCIGATYSWNTFLHFYLTNKDKKFLKNAFGNYISPELIDEMYKSGEPPKLGGDSGVRTAYFTDIQGFSTFSEKLSATQLVELLNEYLTEMTNILLEENGTLDKYEGDAIIAFFGAPMPLEDHCARSCRVAHKMQEKLAELRMKWQSEGDKWPEIVHNMRMRIGINSGEIVTGNMGSHTRMNYTMMGDAVNLAARLEESAKQYGIFTQVSEDSKVMAQEQSKEAFLFREVDTVKVVGKSVPVTTYDLLGLKETAPEFLKKLSDQFSLGISLYKEQRFDEAIVIFKETLELEWQRFPDLKGVKTNPSEIYIKRCEEYKQTPPPPNWDGVFTLTSK